MATKKNTKITAEGKEYGYFRITKTIGHEIKNGKQVPIRKQFYGTSKKNALEKYEEWKREQEAPATSIVETFRTFGDLADHYSNEILAVNSKYAQGTRDLYRQAYQNHIKDSALRDKLVQSVRAEDIQRVYNSLSCGPTGMATVHKFMRGLYRWLTQNRYCDDVLSAVIIPEKKSKVKTYEKSITTRTDEEMELILGVSKGTDLYTLFVLAVYTGMRISELLALEYSDIKDGIIHVSKQFYRGTLKLPKQEKTRDIPEHPMVAEALKDHHARHPDTDLVMVSSTGNHMDYHNVLKRVDRFYKKHNIEHKKFHAFRATFCTSLCKAGVPLQVASVLMGHASVEITSKYYAAVDKDEKLDAVLRLKSF